MTPLEYPYTLKAPRTAQTVGGHDQNLGGSDMRKTTRLEQLHQMIVDPGEECIIWPYGKNGDGYGAVRSDGREQMAHRCALISTTGPAPAGMEAAHGPCHTRACVNPRHLSWKTRTQNEADKVRDGTSSRGEAHGRSKLGESEVLTIRSEHAAGGVSYSMLGRRFNVSPYTIGKIVRRQAWGWLVNEVPEQEEDLF